ncbi:MAG: hypothetical protein ACI4TH_01175 [Candidatus Ornithomonoglobus sp.]
MIIPNTVAHGAAIPIPVRLASGRILIKYDTGRRTMKVWAMPHMH